MPTEDDLVAAFKPEGLNPGAEAAGGLKNTISSLRAINVLETQADGTLQLGAQVPTPKSPFDGPEFRRVLQSSVFDLGRDGDIWATQRRGRPHQWRPGSEPSPHLDDGSGRAGATAVVDRQLQALQPEQFGTNDRDSWAIVNDTRWLPASRWIVALGLATPSVMRDKTGVVPLPVIAVEDALRNMPEERIPIHDLLARIGQALPVLHGGSMRSGLVSLLGTDPDPGIIADCADSSVGQALRILEERGRIRFETLPDAQGIRLSRFDDARQTHVIVKSGGKK